ncbi:hypothetical protein A7982_12638 [Minicystis rosea]|nr:hypothetical protein A7982_12638 [Minicystis rosea]
MARRLPEHWKDLALGVVLFGVAVAILVTPQAPRWMRGGVVVLGALGSAFPVLVLLALVPWHFIARYRGLARRSKTPSVVSVADGMLLVEHGERRARHALDAVARARIARNANWTESTMLEDAVGLFAANGREMVRLPLSAKDVDVVLRALEARGIPIEHVEVSAPAVLD